MKTFEPTVGLLGPTLSTLLRAARRVILIIASLALALTACGPVGVAGLPGGDPTEDIADDGPAPEAGYDYDPTPNCYPGMPPAACATDDGGDGVQVEPPEGGADDNSPDRPTVPAPDCERAGPMVPC
jgi:hypothetical protein